jgi:hypothetical protein
LFGLAAKWRRNPPDRLSRLAKSIEAIGERDRRLVEESALVDRFRAQGAVDLHEICRKFVDKINAKLSDPAVVLDPPVFSAEHFNDSGPNLFQISLRGRLLQLEFEATDELYSRDDFRHPYVLRGAVRSFNQDLLDRHGVDEQMIFYCPGNGHAFWYFLDGRTYHTGRVSDDYLISEMEQLL